MIELMHNRSSMMIELMDTHTCSSKERFGFMLFLKILFKLYAEIL